MHLCVPMHLCVAMEKSVRIKFICFISQAGQNFSRPSLAFRASSFWCPEYHPFEFCCDFFSNSGKNKRTSNGKCSIFVWCEKRTQKLIPFFIEVPCTLKFFGDICQLYEDVSAIIRAKNNDISLISCVCGLLSQNSLIHSINNPLSKTLIISWWKCKFYRWHFWQSSS